MNIEVITEVGTPNLYSLLILARTTEATGNVVEERGGYYDRTRHIWVDKNFAALIGDQPKEELPYLEAMAGVTIEMGLLYGEMLRDSHEGKIWPLEVLDEANDGGSILLNAAETNHSIVDPYAVKPRLHEQAIPNSHAYRERSEKIRRSLEAARSAGGLTAEAEGEYLNRLIQLFTFDEDRTSDFGAAAEADKVWSQLPKTGTNFTIAGYLEAYMDPLRRRIEDDARIRPFVQALIKEQGLAPWAQYPEVRIMARTKGREIPPAKMEAIRTLTYESFGEERAIREAKDVEHGILLFAGGYGLYPGKQAKSFPNNDKIERSRSIQYDNVKDATEIIGVVPLLRSVFPNQFGAMSEAELLQRIYNSLTVPAHEESHFYRRLSGAIEEMKADASGLYIVACAAEDERFDVTQEDMEMSFTAFVGGSLYTYKRIRDALKRGEDDIVISYSDYYIDRTMLINFFDRLGLFLYDGDKITGINFERVRASLFREELKPIIDQINAIRLEQADPGVLRTQLFDESIWNKFNVPE